MGEREGVHNRLTIDDFFTGGKGAYDGIEWEARKAEMPPDDSGEGAFSQEGVVFPKTWSQLATNIVASKYFYGELGKPEREYHVQQLVDRVSEKIADMSVKQGYFTAQDAEKFQKAVGYIAIHQLASFNSPVWFNVGVDKIVDTDAKKGGLRGNYKFNPEKNKFVRLKEGESYRYPQTAACFIQSVEDTMEDIMRLTASEAMLFKYGSGTGTNSSTLRSSKEKLSGGGKPSGPVYYAKFRDDVAAIVKSGGKTRRAAKTEIENITHPDIIKFIIVKAREEDKKKMLMEAGVSEDEANETVAYQNTNFSVRVTDDFMNKVVRGEKYNTIAVTTGKPIEELDAKHVFRLIAENAWKCGDPGLQYDTTINRWHTCMNSGRINASNPCSEYMFIDDSSCNLASLNLLKFLKDDGTFGITSFKNTIRTMIIAQDVIIDGSSYPGRKIARNSHGFRPLGLGYANAGAFLMSLGLPYDSEEGRQTLAAVTSLMTATAYQTSNELARTIGPFKEFTKNKEPMLDVIRMHRDENKRLDRKKICLEGVVEEATKIWERDLRNGKRTGFRNAQVTVLAPTGTIAFMMDCDTTGLEPDTMLVKMKKLSGGGLLRIVNQSVRRALKKVGYDKKTMELIEDYIDKNSTIEKCPYLDAKHLPIFDGSMEARDENGEKIGKRALSYKAHVDMMAAIQPFLSGAISKTVNMPHDSTAEDVYNVFFDAWKRGIKSITIYRDGSKASQVIGGKKIEKRLKWGEKKKPPRKREAYTETISIYGQHGEAKVHFVIGEDENGEPIESFINFGKAGSPHSALYAEMGKDLSRIKQLGDTLENVIDDCVGTTADVSGRTNHPYLKECTSVKDLLGKILALQYRGRTEYCQVPPTNDEMKNLRHKILERRRAVQVHEPEGDSETLIDNKNRTKIKCLNCGGWADRVGCKTTCSKCGKEAQTNCGGQ